MKRLLIAILLLFSGSGWAVCTVSTVNASFGSVTSFALSSTGEVQTTGTLVVSCDTVLNLLTNDSVTLTYTSASIAANSRATMKRTDNAAIATLSPRACAVPLAAAETVKYKSAKPIPGMATPCSGCWGQGATTFRFISVLCRGRTSRPGRTRCC